MQKFRPNSISKACLALLSLTLLTQTVIGFEITDRVSNLDNIASAYIPRESNNYSSTAQSIETTLKLDSSAKITNSTKTVNLSLRDADIKQALRMIADKARLNIAFDSSVDGKITIDLNNIDLNSAFMVIFKASQLTYTKDGNAITVMTQEAAKNVAYTRQNMTVIPIKYVSAESVAEFLNENLFKSSIFGLSTKPIVSANPRTNQIMVFGTNSDVIAVKRVLPVLDTKPVMANFKVNHTTPKEMASLICSSLFYNSEITSAEQVASDNQIVLGGGTVACRDTGADSINEEGLASFKANPLTVTYFPELGRISTYGGSIEQINIIRDFIKQHDKKQLMAYIELSVIELNEKGSKEFSNEWNLWTPFINLSFSPTEGLTTNSTSPFFLWGDNFSTETTYKTYDENGHETGTTKQQDHVSKSNNKALTYKLKYLVENGNGRVLTNPKIMVTNGRKATIDMTSDYVKSVTSQVLQSSSSITSATQRTYEIGSDEGLLIEIVPFISPDGYVSMNISPEFATIKERVYALSDAGTSELAATLLQRRDLELKNIRIRDGETLVLAGLIKESETQDVKKMPFLSDLPFIGTFFRGSTSSKSKEELVIVVTPHIVKDNADPDLYNL